MKHLLCPNYFGKPALLLALLLLFSHTLIAGSWVYMVAEDGVYNEFAQDTMFLEYNEFIDLALVQIGQIKAAQLSVFLAQNQVQQVRDQRFLPSLRMESEHGISLSAS